MDLLQFEQIIKEHLVSQPFISESASISFETITKNNDTVLHGLIIREPDTNITPTIYIDGFLKAINENKISVEEALSEMTELYQSYQVDRIDNTEALLNADNIYFKIINADLNQEYLQERPHRLMPNSDLAMVYAIKVDGFIDKNAVTNIAITNHIANHLHLSEEEIYQLAMAQTEKMFPPVLSTMDDVIFQMMGMEHTPTNWIDADIIPLSMDMPMLILTNENKTYGASTIAYPGLLEKISEKLGGDMIMLPSSIHETILLPMTEITSASFEELKSMVQDINRDNVSDEEVLSDHPYVYDADKKVLISYEDYTDSEHASEKVTQHCFRQ